MSLNCGLAAWTVRFFSAFVLVECVFVLVFGAAGWTAYLAPPEPAGEHAVGAAADAAYASSSEGGGGGSADGHGFGDGGEPLRRFLAGSAEDAELLVAMVAARQEVPPPHPNHNPLHPSPGIFAISKQHVPTREHSSILC
jgi:hypothetical protein